MVHLAALLAEAKSHHASGRHREAEQLYRQILAADPSDVETHYLLGTACHVLGRPQEAIAALAEAVRLNPRHVEAHHYLGFVLAQLQAWDQAISSYQQALHLQPDYAEVAQRLQHALGGRERSEGDRLAAEGRTEDAIICWRRALELRPDDGDAMARLAATFDRQERYDEGVAAYRSFLKARPNSSGALNNLGVMLSKQGTPEEGLKCFRRALELNPADAESCNNLGVALTRQGQFDEAVANLQRAVELKPDYVEAHNNLGNAWGDRHVAEAIACYQRALQLNPRYGAAHCNMARRLESSDRLDEALVAYQRAVESSPGDAELFGNYGAALLSAARQDEAIAAYRTALRLNPRQRVWHGNLVYALNLLPDYDAATIFAEHREWGRRHADPLTATAAPHANDRTPGRRLRIGYVASHFREHAVNCFTEPILTAHDHQAVEVFCYNSALPGEADATTTRLRGCADHWREIVGLGDQHVSELVRRDRIDVLVDLAGHIGGSRLLMFAYKPAPVQVTYIGYQNTTGMLAMDYRLTDDWSDPPGMTDRYYTERLYRLPRSFFCFRAPPAAPDVAPSPASTNGFVTFGSFNNPAKLTPQVLATWAEVLAGAPNSRLLMLAPRTTAFRESVRDILARQGVGADRVELFFRGPQRDFLERVNQVDVALDPFPFNGHTTTCDCLHQGVPVLTLAGGSYASRFGGSALVTLDLREFIADSRAGYVAIAHEVAAHLDRLSALRAELRGRMLASPLVDAAGFTRNLEAAYRAMWVDWCAKPSP